MKQFLNYINGEFVATDKTFEKRAPVNNQIIGMAVSYTHLRAHET